MEAFEIITIPVNKPYTVELILSYDDPVVAGEDFDFDSKEENAAYERKFHSGELVNAVITARVSAHGFSESESIGGCHLASNNLRMDAVGMAAEHALIPSARAELNATFDKIRSLPMLPKLTLKEGGIPKCQKIV